MAEEHDTKGKLQDIAVSIRYKVGRISEAFREAIRQAYGPGILEHLSAEELRDLESVYTPILPFKKSEMTKKEYNQEVKDHEKTIRRLQPTLLKLATYGLSDEIGINGIAMLMAAQDGDIDVGEEDDDPWKPYLEFILSDMRGIDSDYVLLAMFRMRVQH